MPRILTEEELAARNAMMSRMDKVQQEQAARGPRVAENVDPNIERCPHGIPLRKSCPKCDVVTPDQIKDSVPLGSVNG